MAKKIEEPTNENIDQKVVDSTESADESPKLDTYHFNVEGVAIEATSYEDALEKLANRPSEEVTDEQ